MNIHFIIVVFLIHNNNKKTLNFFSFHPFFNLLHLFPHHLIVHVSPLHQSRLIFYHNFFLQKQHKQLQETKFVHRSIVSTNLCNLHQFVEKPKMKIISSHLIPTHIRKLNPKPMDPQSSLNIQFANVESQCDSITLHSSYSKHVKTLTQVYKRFVNN